MQITKKDFDDTLNNRDILLPDYALQEKVLADIFTKYPNNTTLAEVILKVNLLNAFYSTGILDVVTVATHITTNVNNVDARIQSGDDTVVCDIANVFHESKNKDVNHFSFATKYCSFHQPQKFPIFDSFIAECFSQLSKNNYFQKEFSKNTIRNDYSNFKKFYDEFMTNQPALPKDYKEVDRYLWSSLKVQTLNKKNKLQSSPQSNQVLNNAVNNTIKL